jgi:hypothetical protein
MERWYAKLALCLLPLALVPLVFFSLTEGWVSFGGGEKDTLLAFPYTIWAVIYTLAFVVAWVRRRDARTCMKHAGLIATLPLLVGWLIMLVAVVFQTPQLKYGGLQFSGQLEQFQLGALGLILGVE